MTLLDSPRNARIQAAVQLRDRAARLATGQTLVDGARECRRAVAAGAAIQTAFVCPGLLTSDDARATLATLESRGAEIVEVSERVHDRLVFGNRGDGIVLVVAIPAADIEQLKLPVDPLLLVTEDVEKPGNLGAILRTADAAGCDAVIAIGGTDLYNPNVIRASVGTVFSLPLATATADWTITWLRDHRIRPVAARVDAPRTYSEADLRGPLALVLGSEADGLSATWHDADIESVRLLMHGVADSLNVSVAAAVLAFEARRQRDLSIRNDRSAT